MHNGVFNKIAKNLPLNFIVNNMLRLSSPPSLPPSPYISCDINLDFLFKLAVTYYLIVNSS